MPRSSDRWPFHHLHMGLLHANSTYMHLLCWGGRCWHLNLPQSPRSNWLVQMALSVQAPNGKVSIQNIVLLEVA
eukprot:1139847-Pelagomonas_calceolata.AAC.5